MTDENAAVVLDDETGADASQDDAGQVAKPEGEPTDDSSEGSEGDSPPPAEGSGDENEPGDAKQKRIAELAYENRQLKRELDASKGSDDEPAEPEPIKTLKDFGYDEQKFNDYLIDKAAERVAATSQKSSRATEAQRAEDEYSAREAAYAADKSDFMELVHHDDLRISPEMARFMKDPESDVGLDVAYHLGKNPNEAARIAALPETGQYREMVKLESKIAKSKAKLAAEKSKPSNAPEPPARGVGDGDPGSAKPVSAGDPKSDDLSDAEWLAQRNKDLSK